MDYHRPVSIEKPKFNPPERRNSLVRNSNLLLLLGMVAILTVIPQDLPAEEKPSVMFILDASGSMWGEVDGTDKIKVARNVIDDLLKDWPSNINLGLMAYGHRKEKSCSDIETLVEPGALNRNSYSAKIQSISPLGMTPLTASVKQAAEKL